MSGFSPLRQWVLHRVSFDPRIDDFRLDGAIASPMRPFMVVGKAAAFHFRPRLAGISALPEAAAGTTALEEVGPAHTLPARRPERLIVDGSMARSTKPALSLMNFTRRQVIPPSVLLYIPLSGLFAQV